ncbi:unnamed protein product [Clonostachys rosea f. rosea IK726]|uniref:Uncharacterized protein n=1 Tax=Clonostachys rosea f. rosea IK726 TaxID=1349383 RepID=A0ACA9UFC2_BIOOC|nr:unnamed protein product [Clonostachys rosea f. rosea IK726]
MVNGCTDFPIMFQMLVSALMPSEEKLPSLSWAARWLSFSIRQIRKMRVYAAPLLSPDTDYSRSFAEPKRVSTV